MSFIINMLSDERQSKAMLFLYSTFHVIHKNKSLKTALTGKTCRVWSSSDVMNTVAVASLLAALQARPINVSPSH